MNTLEAQTAYIGSTEIQQVRLGDQLVLAPNGDALWYKANEIPSLDLRFADNKSLVDATTGTNLIDFTRAGSGRYVGSDGLIKTATTNLLSWSEDFTNAAWQTTSPGKVTLIPGVADPFGGTNATTFFHNSGAGDTGWLRRLNSGTIGLSYRLSFWIRRRSGSGAFIVVLGDNISQTISGITSEWQRVSVSNIPTSTILRTYFKADSAGDQFDVFGAQLEQSSTVGEYVKTTSTINSAPRFDHDPTTGESLGLLVEEQRQNLLLRSEEFDDASWSRTTIGSFGTVSISNATTSPDGKQTADLIVPTSGGLLAVAFVSQAIAKPAVATTYTLSCFGKKQSFDVLRIFARDTATNNNRVEYAISLDDGSVVTAPTAVGTFTAVSGSGVSYANGWYRAQLTFTTSTETNITTRIYANDSIATVGDDVSGIYIWGAQLEEGPFPTSYIPTEGSAVTRAADVASISGSNFSSWYRQDEGTLFASIVGFFVIGFPRIYELSDGSSNNVIRSQLYGANTVRNNVIAGGVNYMSQDGGYISEGVPGKTAFALAENDCSIVTNGGAPSVDNTVTMPSNLNQMGILGTTGGTSIANSTISRLTYWPTRLSNEVLQTITQ